MTLNIAEAFAEIDSLLMNADYHGLTKGQIDALSLAKRIMSSFELLAIASSVNEEH